MKVDSLNKLFLQLFHIQKNKGMILIPDSCSEEEIEAYRRLISEGAKDYRLYFDLATLQTDILKYIFSSFLRSRFAIVLPLSAFGFLKESYKIFCSVAGNIHVNKSKISAGYFVIF